MIAYNCAHDGRSADVWRMERRGQDWVNVPLGRVEGGDPMNTFINAALQYTAHDAELFSLIGRNIDHRLEEVTSELKDAVKRLDVALEDLDHAATILALRYV